MLYVRVLGEIELETDDGPIPLPARTPARLLLAWLALHPGRHARSEVAGTLWPNVREDSARTSLRSALAALRAAIGPAALEVARGHVGLAPSVRVDALEFERRLPRDPAGALALSRGPLLAGIDEDWALRARDAQLEREADALRALAEQADPATALALLRRRAALDPLAEPAHRDLMRRLSAAGDRGGALVVYRRLAERLRRQLGVAPSTATRALVAELRADHPAPRSAAPRALPARLAAVHGRGPIAGRDHELARLRAAADRAGRSAVLLTGESGIGKTRLLAELGAALHRQGAVVLYGRADEDVVEPYRAVADSLYPHADLGALASPGGESALTDDVGVALDAVAGGRPLALLLDDLHWADPATARLLGRLATVASAAPHLLVIAYRETDIGGHHPLPAVLAQLQRELPTEHVALRGLDRDAVATIAGDALDADALHARTGGNPFFLEEVLRAGIDAPASDGVIDAVARRVQTLGAHAHAVLVAGAVAGPEFDAALVAQAVGLPALATLDVLDAAVGARLLVEDSGRFRFAHALVRDALTEPLTAARRARIHELLAEALEARPDSDRHLGELARHALAAAHGGGDPDRAADLAERAAARASAVFAHDDAAELIRRALAMLERRGIGGPRRAQTLCALGETLQRAGEPLLAADALERASELARLAHRPDLLARAALAAGGLGVAVIDVDPARIARLEECLAGLPHDEEELRAQTLARLAIELGYDADAERRDALGRQAVALARRGHSARALALALSARHVTLWGPDHTIERLDLAREMIELGYRSGDPELALQGRNWRIADLWETGDGAAIRADLDAYAALAAETRLLTYAWWVPTWRATLACLDGRLDEGMELSHRARLQGRRAGDPNADVITAQQELLRTTISERFSELDPLALGPDHVATRRSRRGPAARAYRLTFAWLHAERGELDRARHTLDAALNGGLDTIPRDANWLSSMTATAQACALLGDTELARGLQDQLSPFADRIAVSARGAFHGGSISYLLAMLAATVGETGAADRHFADAIRCDERSGAPVWVARDERRRAKLLEPPPHETTR